MTINLDYNDAYTIISLIDSEIMFNESLESKTKKAMYKRSARERISSLTELRDLLNSEIQRNIDSIPKEEYQHCDIDDIDL